MPIWLWRRHAARRRIAEFRAAAEGGQWFTVRIGNWVNDGYRQHRTVTYARLRAQHPANWWDYDPARSWLEWWDYREGEQTRPRPYRQPAQQYSTTPQPRGASATYYPQTASPTPPTATQNYNYNMQGSAAQNFIRNTQGNQH